MSTENTIENNKLLAEFMSIIFDDDKNEYYDSKEGLFIGLKLKYNSDWNWLMEVVEKIETTSYNVPQKFQRGFMKNTLTATGTIYSDYDDRKEFLGWSSYCTLGTQTLWDSTMLSEDVKRYDNKIVAVYNACIEFVKWYNSKPELQC